ncbi:hypothetical protein BZA77DRAFT_289887 [Pyronema omphalodes]|nr:hypothetical protein BZA77DRAFT_289887 [Pyronema omphalodes]
MDFDQIITEFWALKEQFPDNFQGRTARPKIQHERNDSGTQILDAQDRASSKNYIGKTPAVQANYPPLTNNKNSTTDGTLAEILAAEIFYGDNHSAFFVCLGIAPPYTQHHARFLEHVSDFNRRLRSPNRDRNPEVSNRKQQFSTERRVVSSPSFLSDHSFIGGEFISEFDSDYFRRDCFDEYLDSSNTSFNVYGGLGNSASKNVWGSEGQGPGKPDVSTAAKVVDNELYFTEYLESDSSSLDSGLPNIKQERKSSLPNWPVLRKGVRRSKAAPFTFEQRIQHRKSVRSYWQEFTRSTRRSIITSLRASNLEAFDRANAATEGPVGLDYRPPRYSRKLPCKFIPCSIYKPACQYPNVTKLSKFWEIIEEHTYRPRQPLPEISVLNGTSLKRLIRKHTKLFNASKREDEEGFFFPDEDYEMLINGIHDTEKERLLPRRSSSRSSSIPEITLSNFSVVDSSVSNKHAGSSSSDSVVNLAAGENISPDEAVEHLTNLINTALGVRTEIMQHNEVIIEHHPIETPLRPGDEFVSLPDGIEITTRSPKLTIRQLNDIDKSVRHEILTNTDGILREIDFIDLAGDQALRDVRRLDASIFLGASREPSQSKEQQKNMAGYLLENARICGRLVRKEKDRVELYIIQEEMEQITKDWIQLLMEAFGREDDYIK